MFTKIAKMVAWWVAEPSEKETENPIMMVARSLAAVNPDVLEISTCKMDKMIAAGIFWGISEEENNLNCHSSDK